METQIQGNFDIVVIADDKGKDLMPEYDITDAIKDGLEKQFRELGHQKVTVSVEQVI